MSKISQDEIREFVIAAHGDLKTVKETLAAKPELLNLPYEPWNETPLGAASHVGNREIAEFLLDQGAPMTICTAAMLARVKTVQAFLDEDPGQANASGSHGISLLFHAGLGGSTVVLDMIKEHGGNLAYATHALQAASAKGHIAAVEWLLRHGADVSHPNQQGQTPLAVAEERGDTELVKALKKAGGIATLSSTDQLT